MAPDGVSEWMRRSAVPYLSVAVLAALIPRFAQYFLREEPTLRGQPLGLVAEFALFAVAVVLWFLYQGRATTSGLLKAFLALMGLSWCIHLLLMLVHGDNFNHAVWLVLPFLAMVWLKSPSSDDAWTALLVLAWLLAGFLSLAWILEAAGVVAPFPIPDGVRAFQQENYWLPLEGFMGVEGRWTGPFGHNTRAAMAAALVFVIGIARWRRSTVPLIVLGGFFLLVTSVRASYLGVLAGVVLLVLFSRRGFLGRVPVWAKFAVVAVGVLGVGALFSMSGAGLTGRENIWPAFWRLFLENPVIGAGGSGISAGERIVAISGDAHNLILDEFARNGVVGAAMQLGALAVGLVIVLWAAARGFPAPAAVLAPYLIASQTDVQNDWIHLSYFYVLIVITVVCAGQWRMESEAGGRRVASEQRESSDGRLPGGVDTLRDDAPEQLSPGP